MIVFKNRKSDKLKEKNVCLSKVLETKNDRNIFNSSLFFQTYLLIVCFDDSCREHCLKGILNWVYTSFYKTTIYLKVIISLRNENM